MHTNNAGTNTECQELLHLETVIDANVVLWWHLNASAIATILTVALS